MNQTHAEVVEAAWTVLVVVFAGAGLVVARGVTATLTICSCGQVDSTLAERVAKECEEPT